MKPGCAGFAADTQPRDAGKGPINPNLAPLAPTSSKHSTGSW